MLQLTKIVHNRGIKTNLGCYLIMLTSYLYIDALTILGAMCDNLFLWLHMKLRYIAKCVMSYFMVCRPRLLQNNGAFCFPFVK